jgi:GR25 family glycosyltransferase involved in LPS biosynthesis
MDYTILAVSERCSLNVKKNKELLRDWKYNEIEFFNGNIKDPFVEIKNKNIQISWNPFDGRKTPPLNPEIGEWVSHLNILDYIHKNKIKYLVVLEDDAILLENFQETVLSAIKESKGFDFISLYFHNADNKKPINVDAKMNFLEKTNMQHAYIQGLVYSFRGAHKILKFLEKAPIEYTIDCTLFEWSRKRVLEGYRLKEEFCVILHDESAPSEIDSLDYRYVV